MRAAIISLILFLVSCKKKNPTTIDFGQGYYPVEKGNFIIFEVDSTVYNEFTSIPLSYKYLLKEKLENAYTSESGLQNFRLVRYIKKYNPSVPYESMLWTIRNVWMVNISQNNLEVLQENVRDTKLVFPVKNRIFWNGNAKNNLGKQNYEYTYIDTKDEINSLKFDSTLRVTQQDFRTGISYDKSIEKYAKSTGLIYKEFVKIKFPQFTDTALPLELVKIKHGVIYKQKILAFGNE